MSSLNPLRDRPYLLLSLTSLFWAGNAVVARAAVLDFPPVALAATRWTLAFLLLLPFTWRTLVQEWAVIRRHLGILAVLALASVGAFNTILYWALVHTTAINATLMQSTGPLLIGLWSFVLFRDPLTRAQLGGILLSLAGIAAIVSGGDFGRLAALELNAGDIAVVIAIGIYALYSTLLRKRPPVTPLSLTTVMIGIGALAVIPAAFIEHRLGAALPAPSWPLVAAVAYVVIFPSILSITFYNRGVELIGANRSGPFLHLIPLFGMILAIVFLGERPGWHHAVGAALVIAGVVIASRPPPGGSEPTGNRVADGPGRA